MGWCQSSSIQTGMVLMPIGAAAAWAGFLQGVHAAVVGSAPADPELILPGVLFGAPLTAVFVGLRRVRPAAVVAAGAAAVLAAAAAWWAGPGFWGWTPAGALMVATPILADIARRPARRDAGGEAGAG